MGSDRRAVRVGRSFGRMTLRPWELPYGRGWAFWAVRIQRKLYAYNVRSMVRWRRPSNSARRPESDSPR